MWGSVIPLFYRILRTAFVRVSFTLVGVLFCGTAFSQVVLNEVMFDPSGSEYTDEFVELLNVGRDTVDLAGWRIGDGTELDALVDAGQGLRLAPGQFALVLDPGYFQRSTTYDSLIPPAALVVTIEDGAFGSGGFSNSRPETVFLVNAAGDTVGAYRYSLGNAPGFSDEKIDPARGDSSDNWADARVFLGTPGFANSVAQKEIDLALEFTGGDTLIVAGQQQVTLVVTARNVGKRQISSASVLFWWDHNNDALPAGRETLLRQSLPALAPGDSASVVLMWAPPGVGLYLVRARAEVPGDQALANNVDSTLVVAPCPVGQVVINEIYYRPAAGEPEWIELYNAGSDSVSLAGWWLSDGTHRGTVQLGLDAAKRLVPPRGYAVLAEESEFRAFEALPGGAVIQPAGGFPSLNNAGDVVVVRDCLQLRVDSLRYRSSWGGENGVSLERVRPQGLSTARENWRSCVAPGGSTPGRKNSVSPPDRALSVELRVQPRACVTLEQTVSILCVVCNSGLASLPSARVVLKAAQAGPCGGDTLVLGRLDVPSLAPLDSFAVPVSWVPGEPGRWDLTAWAAVLGDSAVTGTARASLNVSLPQLAVVINEIQFKPPTGEPEWVEVFNASQQDISLDAWQFGDSRRRVVLDSVGGCLAAGEYALVLPPDADLPPGTPPGVPVWRARSAWPGLSNSGDAVVLVDPCGYVVDSVFYRPSWAKGPGSLERLLATASSTDSANWGSSSDPAGATPGRLNTATPRDVDLALVAVQSRGARVGQTSKLSLRVANVGLSVVPAARVAVSCLDTGEELWSDTVTALAPGDTLDLEATVELSHPGWGVLLGTVACEADSRSENDSAATRLYVSFPFGAVTLNELCVAPLAGQAEWVEIANVSQWSVDLFGWALQDARGDAGTGTVRDSLVLPPGGFALLAGDSSALNAWELPSGALFAVVSLWPGFNDEADAVRLMDPAGAATDSARYDAAWPVERGYSLEKLRPELPSARRQSWTRCTDPTGGTPGAPNSVFAYTMPGEAAFSVSPNPFSPDGDGNEDVAVFSLNFPAAQTTVRLRVFDVLGRRVRELLASEPCGPHRLVVWDGRDDLGRPCRVGPYVALLEWRAESGLSGVERAVVVLAW